MPLIVVYLGQPPPAGGVIDAARHRRLPGASRAVVGHAVKRAVGEETEGKIGVARAEGEVISAQEGVGAVDGRGFDPGFQGETVAPEVERAEVCAGDDVGAGTPAGEVSGDGGGVGVGSAVNGERAGVLNGDGPVARFVQIPKQYRVCVSSLL